jgi:hypothetical protein
VHAARSAENRAREAGGRTGARPAAPPHAGSKQGRT